MESQQKDNLKMLIWKERKMMKKKMNGTNESIESSAIPQKIKIQEQD